VPDLFAPGDAIDWGAVDLTLERLAPGIHELQKLSDRRITQTALVGALRAEPTTAEVAARLVSAPDGMGFADGSEIATGRPQTDSEAITVAGVLKSIGLFSLIPPGSSIKDLLRVALVASDAQRRRFRRSSSIRRLVDKVVQGAIADAHSTSTRSISLLAMKDQPQLVRGRVEYVVGSNGTPVVGIARRFQASGGGRQQRELELLYPQWQTEFDTLPMALILIADGAGFSQMSDKTLTMLFESIAECMTLAEAQSGRLTEAIRTFVDRGGVRLGISAGAELLIRRRLADGGGAKPADLPLPGPLAQLTLAQFVAGNPQLALRLNAQDSTVTWQRATMVTRASALRLAFSAPKAQELLGDLLGWVPLASSPVTEGPIAGTRFAIEGDAVLPDATLVAALNLPFSHDIAVALARLATRTIPTANITFLVMPVVTGADELQLRQLQPSLPTNVVVLDSADLQEMAESANEPRDELLRRILRLSDLTKVSPFVLTSVAPNRVFYGRDAELGTLRTSIETNSVALVGGRRIGKTSLMQRLRADLQADGRQAYYGDCQAVRHWDDFRDLVSQRWSVKLPASFQPRHLYGLVNQLSTSSTPPIILLDEIDQLLDWDQHHSSAEVPEAFFRTCRALSQEGSAQFVFAGERIIARKLWDPQSPHWNFCRPLYLRQLNRSSAVALLVDAFESLRVRMTDVPGLQEQVWRTTNGHPQIVQFLGDRLLRRLNAVEAEARGVLTLQDVREVTAGLEYREHYVTTYWGQATEFERLLSLWIASGSRDPSSLARCLTADGIDLGDQVLNESLRMLELYGIIDIAANGYDLRAAWFPEALDAFGGLEVSAEQLVGRLK